MQRIPTKRCRDRSRSQDRRKSLPGGGSREEPTGKVSSTKRKKVDTGKLLALRKAGWSMKKIGEELGISEGSVFNYLKKLEEDEVVKRIAKSGKGDKG